MQVHHNPECVRCVRSVSVRDENFMCENWYIDKYSRKRNSIGDANEKIFENVVVNAHNARESLFE